MSDPPRTPDQIGLPSWPSTTARQGATSSRQQERDAANQALDGQQVERAISPEERRHREVIAQLEHVVDHMKRIGEMLAAMAREPRL